jgi:hypothetical protein
MASWFKDNRWLWFGFMHMALTACGLRSTATSTQTEFVSFTAATQTALSAPFPAQEEADPTTHLTEVEDLIVCESASLGVQLRLPVGAWECLNESVDWLTVRSPVFELQMSTLGRGPFCSRPDVDESCTREPFYTDDLVELDAWSSYGELKEIFGVTQHSHQGARMWISVKYKDMENHVLSDQEMDELSHLLKSLSPAP